MDDFPQVMARPQDHERGVKVITAGYELSGEVGVVAANLLDRHPQLQPLRDFSIAYVLRHGDMPKSKDRHVWASARKVPELFQALCPYDGVLVVVKIVWDKLPEQAREALVLHELCHFDVNEEKGTLGTHGHDIEEYGLVVREYGQWRPDLTWFAEQMDLGLRKVGAPGNAALD